MTHPPVTLPHLGRPARASTCTPVVRRTRLVHSSGRGQTLSVGTRTSRGMRGDGLAPRCDLLSRSLIRGVRRVLAPRGFRNSGLSTSPRLGPAAGGPRASDGIPGGGAVRRGGLRACVRVCVCVCVCVRVGVFAAWRACVRRAYARAHACTHMRTHARKVRRAHGLPCSRRRVSEDGAPAASCPGLNSTVRSSWVDCRQKEEEA